MSVSKSVTTAIQNVLVFFFFLNLCPQRKKLLVVNYNLEKESS